MKTTFAHLPALSALSLFGLIGGASAQSFSIDSFTIAGGGGTVSGGAYSISGTASQGDGNLLLSGGAFSLTGGFWSILAVQTAGAPLLSIERQGAEVRVFWPLSSAGFVLDQSHTATGIWSQVAFPYATNAAGISVNTPAPTGNKFFRLRKL